MIIKPIPQPSFDGYKSPLKTLWKRGKLKKVVKGIYGDVLTKDTVSLEHLKPHSQGGRTILSNLALASKSKNNARGNKPLKFFITTQMLEDYLKQFKDIRVKGFSGNRYIQSIRKTMEDLL